MCSKFSVSLARLNCGAHDDEIVYVRSGNLRPAVLDGLSHGVNALGYELVETVV